MKISKLILAGAIVVSVSTFAQKDELKALKKLYGKDQLKNEEITEYKNLITKLEGGLAVEEGDKMYTTFYKCMMPIVELTSLDPSTPPAIMQAKMAKAFNYTNLVFLADGLNATLDYEKKTGKKQYTDDIKETITQYKPDIVNVAIALANTKKYAEASKILYAAYKLDPKEVDNLYYAANYAVEAKDFDGALTYYSELKKLNYTGEGTTYLAKNNASGAVETFKDKAMRDKFVELGTYSNPTEEKVQSRRGEIVRNVALILIEKGKTDEAKTAIAEARKEFPNDVSLIVSEADIYLKLNDIPTYQKLIKEALDKNPNDHLLIYNLGVTSANNKQYEEAEKYYRKVMEIKPDYVEAYINMADVILKPDQKIVEEMNKLGYTDKDQKRFEVLKAERQKLFNRVMPILEKANDLRPGTEEIQSSLLAVYRFLELKEKSDALKAKMNK